MKILLIDNSSSFLDFALRCMAKKHEVRVWMGTDKQGNRSMTGDGYLTKVPDWRAHMRWADLIVTSDNVKYTRELESYRKQGYPIFNAHAEAAEWELNRGAGQRLFEKAGIKTLPYEVFSRYDDAIAHVTKTMNRFVSKPSGDADKALTYVSKGPRDMVAMLERWKKKGRSAQPFILQEFAPGVEMAVGGFFGPGGFAPYYLENFEFKKLMNDDYGPATGEQGTLMRYVQESKLADMVLKPLEGELYRQGYCGFFDVSVIVGEKDGEPWPMEPTCARFGWPLFQIQQALHPDPCEWMKDLVDGHHSFEPSEKIAAGVVVAMPDYPYSHLTKKELSGFPIWNVNAKNSKQVHFAEVQLGEGPEEIGKKLMRKPLPVTAGDYVYVASGTGDTVKQATEEAYRITKEIEIPNSPIIRTDIGARLEKQLPILQKHGFATSWRFK